MTRKLICAVSAALLLGATYVGAAPRGGQAASSSSASAPSHTPGTVASQSWGSSERRAAVLGFISRTPARAPGVPRVPSAPTTATVPFGAAHAFGLGGTPHVVRPPAQFARHHIPIRLLAPLLVGNGTYYPYRYLPYDGPVCDGVTENGCELRWMDVPTEDSSESMPQCVEFCPQQQ